MRKSLIKLKFALILTAILAISLFQLPEAHSTEDNNLDKTKVVLNDLVGINIAEYAIHATYYTKTYLKVHPQEVVDCRLLSLQGSSGLRATCAFVYGKLQQIFLSDYIGTILYNQPTTSILNMAKGFLQRYQNYTGNSFYGELRSMLDNITTIQPLTKTSENVKLKISPTGQIVSFLWQYTSYGTIAPTMNVELLYRDGRLKMFLDNWQFKTILDSPKISSEEATATALKALRTFSYDVNSGSVSQFYIAQAEEAISTSLSYVESGTNDGFILRPSWWVGIGFDKHYPGQVTGVTARVWADTGDLSSISPMVFSGGSSIYEPEDTTVPDIVVLSPENKTYAKNEIFLDFRTSEPVSWVDYSLNGQSNVTIDDRYITSSGVISLWGLPEGSHTLQVYAADTYGIAANIGASNIIYFNVTENLESEPVLEKPETSTKEPAFSQTKPQTVQKDPEVLSNDSESKLANTESKPSITEPEQSKKDVEISESSSADSKITQNNSELKNPFPTTLLMAMIASAAMISTGLVAYFVKRSRKRSK